MTKDLIGLSKLKEKVWTTCICVFTVYIIESKYSMVHMFMLN